MDVNDKMLNLTDEEFEMLTKDAKNAISNTLKRLMNAVDNETDLLSPYSELGLEITTWALFKSLKGVKKSDLPSLTFLITCAIFTLFMLIHKLKKKDD